MVVGIFHFYKALKIYKKNKAYSHGEFNLKENTDIKNINEKLKII